MRENFPSETFEETQGVTRYLHTFVVGSAKCCGRSPAAAGLDLLLRERGFVEA